MTQEQINIIENLCNESLRKGVIADLYTATLVFQAVEQMKTSFTNNNNNNGNEEKIGGAAARHEIKDGKKQWDK